MSPISKAYPSNLTRAQYEVLSELLPAAKPDGRPRSIDLWESLNAILYVLVEGCRWRSLPGAFPVWQTVYTDCRNCRLDGTWLAIHDQLHEWIRYVGTGVASVGECCQLGSARRG